MTINKDVVKSTVIKLFATILDAHLMKNGMARYYDSRDKTWHFICGNDMLVKYMGTDSANVLDKLFINPVFRRSETEKVRELFNTIFNDTYVDYIDRFETSRNSTKLPKLRVGMSMRMSNDTSILDITIVRAMPYSKNEPFTLFT